MSKNTWMKAVSVFLIGMLTTGCTEAPPELLGPVQTLAHSGASNPTVAGNAVVGRTYASWVAADGDDWNVWLTRFEDGMPSQPVRVNDVDGDGAPHLQAPAQVAVGPEGNVYALWTNNKVVKGRRFPSSNLRFARSTNGGHSFEPALTVNDDAGETPTSHTFHNLIVADDGTVIASWIDGRRQPTLGGPAEGWEADPDRDVVNLETPGPDIRVAVSTNGGESFSASRIVDMEACPCCRTSMAIGPDGTLFLAWRKIFEGDIRDIVVARSPDLGHSWEEPVRVAADNWVFPGCPHAGPVLTVDTEGTLHVGWYTGRPEAPGIYYARSEDSGRSFSERETLLTDEWVPPSQVALSADPEGSLWVAWEDRRFEQPTIRYLVARAGDPLPIETAMSQPGTNPVLATVGEQSVLAWLNRDRVEMRSVLSPR